MADENGHMDPADFAALMNNNGSGFGGSGLWCFLLIILFFIGALGFNGQPAPAPQQGGSVLDATLAAAGAQGGFVTQSDLDSALHMQALQQGQRDITSGVSQSKYDVTGALSDTEARLTSAVSDLRANQQANAQRSEACCSEVKYNSAQNTAAINENTTATGQRILDRLDRMESDQLARESAEKDRRISRLENRLEMQESQAQNAQQFGAINSRLSMMPTYPNVYAYNAGPSPYCQCGACCGA